MNLDKDLSACNQTTAALSLFRDGASMTPQTPSKPADNGSSFTLYEMNQILVFTYSYKPDYSSY